MRNTTIFLITIALISMLTNFKLYAGQNTGFGIYVFHGIGDLKQPDYLQENYKPGSHYGLGISYHISNIAAFGLEYSYGKFDFDLEGFKNNALSIRPLIAQGEAAEIRHIRLRGIVDVPYQLIGINPFLSGCVGLAEFTTKDQWYTIQVESDPTIYYSRSKGQKSKDGILSCIGFGLKIKVSDKFNILTTSEYFSNYISTQGVTYTMKYSLNSVIFQYVF